MARVAPEKAILTRSAMFQFVSNLGQKVNHGDTFAQPSQKDW